MDKKTYALFRSKISQAKVVRFNLIGLDKGPVGHVTATHITWFGFDGAVIGVKQLSRKVAGVLYGMAHFNSSLEYALENPEGCR